MMAKAPSNRFQTPDEVVAALESFGSGNKPPRKRHWLAVAILLLAGIVLAAGGVVYRIQTDNGDVVITPESPDVEIVLLKGGKEVEVIDTKTNKRVTVPTGVYDVVVKNKPDGIEVKTDRITVSRREQVLVTIERVAKPGPGAKADTTKWNIADLPDAPGLIRSLPRRSSKQDFGGVFRPTANWSPYPWTGNRTTSPSSRCLRRPRVAWCARSMFLTSSCLFAFSTPMGNIS